MGLEAFKRINRLMQQLENYAGPFAPWVKGVYVVGIALTLIAWWAIWPLCMGHGAFGMLLFGGVIAASAGFWICIGLASDEDYEPVRALDKVFE